MASDSYDPVPDLALLLAAGIAWRSDTPVYAGRIAERLGLGEDDSPEAVAGALRDALAVPRGTPDGEQPLTCVRCWHTPASRLLVVHWRETTMRLLCGDCAERDAAEAPDLPGFRMATVLTIGTVQAVSG